MSTVMQSGNGLRPLVILPYGITLVEQENGVYNIQNQNFKELNEEIPENDEFTEVDDGIFENDNDFTEFEKKINNNKDYIKYLDNSLAAYYLENQNENISDVENFLKNYDNNMKLSDLLSFEERKTKEEILNEEKKLLGHDTNLKFEDVYTNNYKTEGKKEEYLLYKFTDNTFNLNNDCDWGARFWNLNSNRVFHYIIDVKQNNNIITLYSKNLWSDATGGDDPFRMFFASYNDYKNNSNYVQYADGIWDVPYEEDGKLLYTQALFSYNNILSKLNTYEYKIEVTGDTYKILSYKVINN